MAFNRELAEEIVADSDDRDMARFFAGREAEIGAFEQARRISARKRQTVFRVYAGAPGCGKSSLLTHLQETRKDDASLLFITLTRENFDTLADVFKLVADRALERPQRKEEGESETLVAAVARYANPTLQALGEAVRIKNAGDVLTAWRKAQAMKDVTVVLVCDDAHALGERQLRTLHTLHTNGLHANTEHTPPSVIVLAGLTHTKSLLNRADIPRKAHNADVDMGAMADDECMESTLGMLEELGAEGTGSLHRAVADQVATWSRGWPQHLNRVQESLCRELLIAQGHLDRVDLRAVERMADAARAEHYEKRLDDEAVFGGDDELIQRIVVAIDGKDVRTQAELRGACSEQIEALKRADDPNFDLTPAGIADALVQKGIVCRGERPPVPHSHPVDGDVGQGAIARTALSRMGAGASS